jgi:hypothetical protein
MSSLFRGNRSVCICALKGNVVIHSTFFRTSYPGMQLAPWLGLGCLAKGPGRDMKGKGKAKMKKERRNGERRTGRQTRA